MDKKILFILILLIPLVSSTCSSGQININEASLGQLDELWGIGPAKAQAIIDERPFTSVEELIRAKGIGEKTLAQIISQGLACVGVAEKESNDEPKDIPKNISEEAVEEETQPVPLEENINLTPIILGNLNSKDIKIDNSNKNQKKDYTVYGLVGFFILILTLIKIRRKNGLI